MEKFSQVYFSLEAPVLELGRLGKTGGRGGGRCKIKLAPPSQAMVAIGHRAQNDEEERAAAGHETWRSSCFRRPTDCSQIARHASMLDAPLSPSDYWSATTCDMAPRFSKSLARTILGWKIEMRL